MRKWRRPNLPEVVLVRATLPPHLRRGGSSRNRETEEGGPDEEGDGNDEEDGKEGEEEPPATEAQKESQEAPQSGTQPPEVEEEYDESLYDPTRYLKSDIIKLRDVAFRGETKEARLIKGHLLGCPKGTEPTIEQINESALFTLRPPSKEYKDEAQDEDEEIDLHEIANIQNLWMPHFQKLGVLADCAPSQWQPLVGWPKLYTPGQLGKAFPGEYFCLEDRARPSESYCSDSAQLAEAGLGPLLKLPTLGGGIKEILFGHWQG